MSDFTSEQVERAAEALWLSQDGRRAGWPLVLSWDSRSEATRIIYREDALAALSAAGAPEKVAPVVDEAALIEFLESPTHTLMESHNVERGTCLKCPLLVHQLTPAGIAAAVAAYLRGESK